LAFFLPSIFPFHAFFGEPLKFVAQPGAPADIDFQKLASWLAGWPGWLAGWLA
jgi:hypothetical protein